MMRIKEQYKKALRVDGVTYNLSGYSEEKLKMVYDGNPHLRFAFEEDRIDEKDFFRTIPRTDEQFVEVEGVELPKSLHIHTADEFSTAIKKTAKAQTKKKSK